MMPSYGGDDPGVHHRIHEGLLMTMLKMVVSNNVSIINFGTMLVYGHLDRVRREIERERDGETEKYRERGGRGNKI